MSSSDVQNPSQGTPIFLLKTRSTPSDGYEQLFATPKDGLVFEPTFVPVLKHHFEQEGIARVESLLRNRKIGADGKSSYGGLIFTSQRAVEAFAKLVDDGKGEEGWPHLHDVPVYSVGPATSKALGELSPANPLRTFGGHTGTGEELGKFIMEHYREWYQDRPVKPPLLFLVGEQRSNSIPRILMDDKLPQDQRIQVDEIVIYKTGVMESFKDDFAAVLQETEDRDSRWVVVFSPTGCGAMMTALGLLDEQTGKVKAEISPRRTFIATIGPTTRNYLKNAFDFEPDVCASMPSPEGVWNGIAQHLGGAGLGRN